MSLVAFPFDPDWSNPVRASDVYLTRVLVGRSGKEQRVSLRTKPRRELAFSVFTEDEAQAQLLDSLLVNGLSTEWGVPWWTDVVPYSGTIAAGATSISIATTNTVFAKAPMVLLWKSPTSWEAKAITSVGASSVACQALAQAWTNPQVIPMFHGRLEDAQAVEWASTRISRASVKFSVLA